MIFIPYYFCDRCGRRSGKEYARNTYTRGGGLDQAEPSHLVDLFYGNLLLGKTEWDDLLRGHETTFSPHYRNVDIMRRNLLL